ncbi:MAG: hypothetical protein ABI947_02245 [Chloroflexota bacterium]
MPYKQIFARLYPAHDLATQTMSDLLTFLPDGRLNVAFSAVPEIVDLGLQAPTLSTLVISGAMRGNFQSATTPDGHYTLSIDTFPYLDKTEYWLTHTDHTNGKFKRAKLTSEGLPNQPNQPGVVASPAGTFFLVDDSGTVRLFRAADFEEAGTFQLTHANTANFIVALAVSDDDQFIAGLSSWKDIVLYNVGARRVAFVRQIRDGVGWYDLDLGYIIMVNSTEAIITVGISQSANDEQNARFSVNAFRFYP